MSTAHDVRRSSALVTFGLLATTLLSAGQALVLVFVVGPGEDTDAFLAAYTAYLPIALVGISLRTSLVPLLGSRDEVDFIQRCRDFESRTAALGIVASGLLLIGSPLLAAFLANDLSSDGRRITLLALVILAPTAYLQFHAGAISGCLNAMRRFPVSIAIYALASLVALASATVLLATIGIVGSPVGLALGSVVLLGAHRGYIRRMGVRARPGPAGWSVRRQASLALQLASGTSASASQQLIVACCLAVVPGGDGSITLYVYAYFFVGMILNLSVLPLSWVTIPDFVDSLRTRGKMAMRGYVMAVVPQVLMLLVPGLAALVVFGRQPLELLFGGVLTGSQVDLLHELCGVLALGMVPAVFFFLGLSLTVAQRRWSRAATTAAIAVSICALVIFAGPNASALQVAGCQVVGLLLASVLSFVALFGGNVVRVGLELLPKIAPIAAAAAAFPLVRLLFGWELSFATSLIGVAAASVLYGISLRLLAPSLIRRPAHVQLSTP